MAIFKGAGVAIVTPMYEDGSVNYDKLAELLEEQIAGGTQTRSSSVVRQVNLQTDV